MSEPILSVVVPTYHRNDLLARCLDCLSPDTQLLDPARYEVIVTDDGSKTTAEALIKDTYPWARWVAGPRKGPAANRNNGARQARGHWLVFTDDDCLPDSGWLASYHDGTTRSGPLLEGRTYADRPQMSLSEESPINESGGNLWSCNFAILRELFLSLGGFDERFPYAALEDNDLKLRLTRAGYRPHFLPEASVCHPWRSVQGWRAIDQREFSTLLYLDIHPEEADKINSRFFLVATARRFVSITLPGIIRYRGAGIKQDCLKHLGNLRMAYVLWNRSRKLAAAQNHHSSS